MEDEVRDEPGLVLISESLVKYHDEEFCMKRPRRNIFYYPGKRIENIIDKID